MDQIFPPVSNADAGSESPCSMQELSSRCKGTKGATTKQKLMDSYGFDLNSNTFCEEKGEAIASAPPLEDPEVQSGTGELSPAEPPQVRCCSKIHRAEQDSSAEPHSRSTGGLLYLELPGTARSGWRLWRLGLPVAVTWPLRFDLPGAGGKAEHQSFEIKPIQDSFYAKLCNHWVALIGVGHTSFWSHLNFIEQNWWHKVSHIVVFQALSSILIMFVIQWVYALTNIVVALLLFLYIGKTSPGLPLGDLPPFHFLLRDT